MIFTKNRKSYSHNALFHDMKVTLPDTLDKKYTQLFQRAKDLDLRLEYDASLKNDLKPIEQHFTDYKPSSWKDIAALFPWTKEYKIRKLAVGILDRIKETIEDIEKTLKENEPQKAQEKISPKVVEDYFSPTQNNRPPMNNYYNEKVRKFKLNFWQNCNKTIEPTADENVNHDKKFKI